MGPKLSGLHRNTHSIFYAQTRRARSQAASVLRMTDCYLASLFWRAQLEPRGTGAKAKVPVPVTGSYIGTVSCTKDLLVLRGRTYPTYSSYIGTVTCSKGLSCPACTGMHTASVMLRRAPSQAASVLSKTDGS